jgi:hypothetical protein
MICPLAANRTGSGPAKAAPPTWSPKTVSATDCPTSGAPSSLLNDGEGAAAPGWSGRAGSAGGIPGCCGAPGIAGWGGMTIVPGGQFGGRMQVGPVPRRP